jgi:hypothetical protein
MSTTFHDADFIIIALWMRDQLLGGNSISRAQLMNKYNIGIMEIEEVEERLEHYGLYSHQDLSGTINQQTTYRYEL